MEMLSNPEKARYNRHLILAEFGEKAQEKLKAAKVLVIGAGGLGAPVLQYLTAAGVGTIGIIDGDSVDESNLQRQVVFAENDIGKMKADAAKSNLQAQNSLVNFRSHAFYLSTENALQIIGEYDLIVDGSDNFQTRYLVSDACVILKKPLVFGSIFKFEGQVSLFNWNEGPTYRCLYPRPPGPNEVPNCSDVGVLGVLPAVVGSIMTNEVIKVIAEIGENLSGRLLLYNALELTFKELKFNKNTTDIDELLSNYDVFCGVVETPNSINVHELKLWMDEKRKFQLIDVREMPELAICKLESDHLPLSDLGHQFEIVKDDRPVVIYCHHGMRSQSAINFLGDKGCKNLINLEGGIHAWAAEIDPTIRIY
ncbi:MAG: molybdopterin/thiamine biosynthesis adenylyltransferase/rhodanese-related sulfurtransferase [Parvicellaceae bacterium]|jgi:molybdopterin/thiamine biosynthesis adenylyltransferase/rhodanese-related sulfurtransferase